jgi:hypothetical protein
MVSKFTVFEYGLEKNLIIRHSLQALRRSFFPKTRQGNAPGEAVAR